MTAVAEATIEQRVEAGAAWLDQHQPGWIDRIDVDRLDVGVSECCPLGQFFGSWWDAPPEVSCDAGLGFYDTADPDMPDDDFGRVRDAEYAELTDAWRALIERRRAEAGAAP